MLIVSPPKQIKTPTAIALGNFDGIHRGHQTVLQPTIAASSMNYDLCSSVVSFSPHPREFFSGKTLKLLTPIAEKAEILADLGFEQLVLLPFNRELAALSPLQFVEQILAEQLQARSISVGSDFRFGSKRTGTGKDLQEIATRFGMIVHLNSLHKCQNKHNEAVRVSSSLIRQALADGEIENANAMLGRPYTLVGEVVTGQQLGRTIGFPTANLRLPPEKYLPRFGVYGVDVLYQESVIKGVMNVGCRPTVAGEAPTIEVHLLNWSGNLYGQTLRVNLLKFLRPEQKFASVEQLKQQITIDCQSVLNN